MRVVPPPPSGRLHESSRKDFPSSAPSAATMRPCSLAKYSWTAAASMPGFASASLQGAVAYVLAELHAVEADPVHRVIGACARHFHGVAERRHAKHAAGAGERSLPVEARAAVEHLAIGLLLRQPLDAVALARLLRVAVRGEHHAERRAAGPFRIRAVQPS